MFHEYYGFVRPPFSKTIETDKLFATTGQKELTARLTYLVRERGSGLVTGEIGSGKSTAVRAFTAGLDANSYLVIYLANPTTGSMGLYRELLLTLGYEPPFSKPRMVSRIRAALADRSSSIATRRPGRSGWRRNRAAFISAPPTAAGWAPAMARISMWCCPAACRSRPASRSA